MLVCVTGGTGFIGSHLVRALLDDGHRVRVLHRQNSKLIALAGLDYESAIGDVTDLDSLKQAFKDCDWIFHVAAVADYWRADKSQLFEVNVEGTRKVLHASQEAKVKRVIFTSSAAAIGLPENDTPSNESVRFNLPPEHFPYGYSKVLAEEFVQEFVAEGLDVVTVNPSVVIGPGDLNMISGSFIAQVYQLQWLIPKSSGGIAVSDVRDIVASHLAAVEKGKTGERYILTTANYSNDRWFAMIADAVGVAPPLMPVPDKIVPIAAQGITLLRKLGINTPVNADQTRMGMRYVYFDASKAHRELHLPRFSMQKSIEETYHWYRKNGYLKDSISTRLLRIIGGLWHRA